MSIISTCRNQMLTIKHYLRNALDRRIAEENKIYGNLNVLLGENCELEKLKKFLKEIELFNKYLGVTARG